MKILPSCSIPSFGRHLLGRSSSISLVFLVALLPVSCGSIAEFEVARDSDDPSEIHRDEQEAIANCMRQEGFDYKQVPFVSSGVSPSPRTYIELSMSEDMGYFAVFGAVVAATTPHGEPVDGLDESEVEAYDDALFGEAFDGGHGELGGCLLVGSEAVRLAREESTATDWKLHDSQAKFDEFMLDLTATSEYAEFSSLWQSCMANLGYEVGVGPLDLEDPIMLKIAFEAVELVAELSAESGEPLKPVTDRVSFDLALEESDQLRDLYLREIEQASADRSCREENWESIFPVLDELSNRIFGIPFNNI